MNVWIWPNGVAPGQWRAFLTEEGLDLRRPRKQCWGWPLSRGHRGLTAQTLLGRADLG